jgi:hypothetical protein
MFRMKTPALVLAVALASIAVPLHAKSPADHSHVNKSIRIADGEAAGELATVNGSISIGTRARAKSANTVNGSVRVGAGAEVGSIDTVNGSITLDEGARAGSVSATNGSIKLGANARVDGDVEAVNGSITIGRGAEVGRNVGNVNGSIRVTGARVGGELRTTSGNVTLVDAARIEGGLTVEKPRGSSRNWGKPKAPRIVIGPGVHIAGPMTFEREVELYVHSTATVGEITGATPVRYSGDEPPPSKD